MNKPVACKLASVVPGARSIKWGPVRKKNIFGWHLKKLWIYKSDNLFLQKIVRSANPLSSALQHSLPTKTHFLVHIIHFEIQNEYQKYFFPAETTFLVLNTTFTYYCKWLVQIFPVEVNRVP